MFPCHVHDLDRIERAPAAPRRPRGMRGLAPEGVFDGHEAAASSLPPAHPELRPHVGEDADVHVVEMARADEPRLRGEQLLRDARPDDDGPGDALAFHHFLGGESSHHDHRLAGVVALAVAGSTLDERVVVRDPGLLGRLRDPVDVAAQRNHGRARTPTRHPGGGDAGDPFLDLEAVVAEDAGDVAGGLDLLEAELAEAEDGIHHHLRQLGALGGALVGDRAEGVEVLGGYGRGQQRERQGGENGGSGE